MAKLSSIKKKRKPRSGSKRGDLSRDKLIAAAIELIDDRGADALTMRALADAVGVTPMALYNHVSSKRDLLASVAEHIIGAAQFSSEHADWRKQIRHCFEVLRDLCLRHPGLPGLLEQDGAAPGAAFAPMEVTLQALQSQGMTELDSARTFFLLIGFTLSQASYQARPIPALEPSEKVRTERIAGRGYKAIERLEMPATWDFDASFAFGISLILNGVEATVSRISDALPQ
jgi:TetR/AcrR family tetracycline transcriptional repressor